MRGENVLLLGEIDLDRDDEPPRGYVAAADAGVVTRLADARKLKESSGDKKRLRKLATLGFEGENVGEVLL